MREFGGPSRPQRSEVEPIKRLLAAAQTAQALVDPVFTRRAHASPARIELEFLRSLPQSDDDVRVHREDAFGVLLTADILKAFRGVFNSDTPIVEVGFLDADNE